MSARRALGKSVIAPKVLNIRWMMHARRALRLAPMEERSAVTDVPIFVPRMR